MNYELVVGLEIHLKIKSPNKLFCPCQNIQEFDMLTPNTHVCPICTGQPGALPVLNKEPLKQSLLLGKALGCKINDYSTFDRKSYFYPDLPASYQITQLYTPTCVDGSVSFFVDADYSEERTVNIRDAHMETDTGKTIHMDGQALLDFNRAGTPLVEVVTGPDFRSADEVVAFLKELQRIARYNGIADADMEKGQMRVDVNISLRPEGTETFGTRVELKNINSFSAIKRAITHEQSRQEAMLTKGESFEQETRRRNDQDGESHSMRSKETALDYRYFPEPDLPGLVLDSETKDWLATSTKDLEIPHHFIAQAKQERGFHKEFINALISDKLVLDHFLHLVQKQGFAAKLVAKWIAGPIAFWCKENYKTLDELPFDFTQFEHFLSIAQDKKLPENQLKILMDEMLTSGQEVDAIIAAKQLGADQVDGTDLANIVTQVLDANTDVVEQYHSGKESVLGFFVGKVMQATKGKASPQDTQQEITKQLKSK